MVHRAPNEVVRLAIAVILGVVVVASFAAGCSDEGGPEAASSAAVAVTTSATAGPTTTVPASTTTTASVLGEGRDQFVALARKLGATKLTDSGLLALGDAACEFAARGTEVLRSYLVSIVEPSLASPAAKVEYLTIFGAASLKLCTQHLAVMQAEYQRMAA